MGLYYEYLDELTYFYEKEYIKKHVEIMESNLSILRVWLSLFGEKYIIKPRANNIYYAKCPHHNADDIPVCINNNINAYFCYGCGSGGGIISLISRHFWISMEEATDIVYAFIKNDTNSLDKDELKILKEVFENYNSNLIDKYLKESETKTKKLNKRIDKYVKEHKNKFDIENISKRLCCSKKYIKDYISNHKQIKQNKYFELGGFAEDESAVDGDYKAFNSMLADTYYQAFLEEDFEATGIIDHSFFENFIYWVNYYNDLNETQLELLKKGNILTINNRTLIDAIFEKRYGPLAEIYLDNKIYDPKLLFALIACDNEEFEGYINLNGDTIGKDKLNEIFNELYKLIEMEYKKESNKEHFLKLIYNNFGRICCDKNFTLIQPINFEFYKDMKKIIKNQKVLKKEYN